MGSRGAVALACPMGNLDLLEDACARLPHATRPMFGGHGLFAPNGGIFAAIVDEDRIVLKLAEEEPRAELVALGGAPWTYDGRMTMRAWLLVPDAFYDEPARLAEWAAVAHRLATPPKGKAKAPASKGAKAPKKAVTRAKDAAGAKRSRRSRS